MDNGAFTNFIVVSRFVRAFSEFTYGSFDKYSTNA